MPYMGKPARRREQATVDDLEITRLQTLSKRRPRLIVRSQERMRQLARRQSELHQKRELARVRVGSVAHIREANTKSRHGLFEVSLASDGSAASPLCGVCPPSLRASSEPPSLGSPYSDIGGFPPATSMQESSSVSLHSGFSLGSSGSSDFRIPTSMSRRRMASNIPALGSRILVPPVGFINEASSLSSPSPTSCSLTPLLCRSLSALSVTDASSGPRTPACQVIPRQDSPPEAPRQSNTKIKRKLSLPSLLSLQNLQRASYPFTPLEDGMSPSALPPNIKGNPLSGLEALLPRQSEVQQVIKPPLVRHSESVPSSLSAELTHVARPRANDQLRRKPLPFPTRTLPSYHATRSPVLPSLRVSPVHRLSMPKSNGLASPLILDATFTSVASPPAAQPSPLQQTVSFTALPDYFNVRAARD